MANMTIRVSDELKEKMDAFDYINWSALFRKFVEERISDFEAAERIAKMSKLTQKDADEISQLIDDGVRERTKKMLRAHNLRR